ncbi:MAG: hypothetical protein SO434_03360 [Eubacteriales bacterium]|nr:hypothetical protein [Eubacteriales bacterium]
MQKYCGFAPDFAGLFPPFTVLLSYNKQRGKAMTKAYCESKLNSLVKDHNHYKKMNYTAAVTDYRTAIENLIYVAERKGVKLGYAGSKAGYLAVK